MILYLDASALVKRYVAEIGSAEIEQLLRQAAVVGTGLITRAEVSSALAKAVRVGILEAAEATAALNAFRSHWQDLVRVSLSEAVVARADVLAWQHGLRGHDAVHLATAVLGKKFLEKRSLLRPSIGSFGQPLGWQVLFPFRKTFWNSSIRINHYTVLEFLISGSISLLHSPASSHGPRKHNRRDRKSVV